MKLISINTSLSSPLTPPPVFKDHKSKVGTHCARINFEIDNHKLRLANLFCLVSVLGSCGNPPMQNSESRILFFVKITIEIKIIPFQAFDCKSMSASRDLWFFYSQFTAQKPTIFDDFAHVIKTLIFLIVKIWSITWNTRIIRKLLI